MVIAVVVLIVDFVVVIGVTFNNFQPQYHFDFDRQ